MFFHDGTLYRSVNVCYEPHYGKLMESGLYRELVGKQMLIDHEECAAPAGLAYGRHRVLRPRELPLISYPYEWCFDQLKDAALLTLEVQSEALSRGMILKDATAYNVQFDKNRPILIDTLSFERYEDGMSWTAYRQFCRHFLAPLALMSSRGARYGRLLRADLEGMSLDLASAALPVSSRFNWHHLLHLHAHAGADRWAGRLSRAGMGRTGMSRAAVLGLTDSLRSAVIRLKSPKPAAGWTDYYRTFHNYSEGGLEEKKSAVNELLDRISFAGVWDVGANTARFSRLSSARRVQTLALDNDPDCVNDLYIRLRSEKDDFLSPLVYDMADPSPAIGWALAERGSLETRHRPDLILALAVVHHLVIGRNLTWKLLAEHWSGLARHLIVEFIPREDSQIAKLLAGRKDVFTDYNERAFLDAFASRYTVHTSKKLSHNGRILYLMSRKHES